MQTIHDGWLHERSAAAGNPRYAFRAGTETVRPAAPAGRCARVPHPNRQHGKSPSPRLPARAAGSSARRGDWARARARLGLAIEECTARDSAVPDHFDGKVEGRISILSFHLLGGDFFEATRAAPSRRLGRSDLAALSAYSYFGLGFTAASTSMIACTHTALKVVVEAHLLARQACRRAASRPSPAISTMPSSPWSSRKARARS